MYHSNYGIYWTAPKLPEKNKLNATIENQFDLKEDHKSSSHSSAKLRAIHQVSCINPPPPLP